MLLFIRQFAYTSRIRARPSRSVVVLFCPGQTGSMASMHQQSLAWNTQQSETRQKIKSFGSVKLCGRFAKGWADNDGVGGVLSQTVPSGDSSTSYSCFSVSWERGKMFLFFRLFCLYPCNLMHQPTTHQQHDVVVVAATGWMPFDRHVFCINCFELLHHHYQAPALKV